MKRTKLSQRSNKNMFTKLSKMFPARQIFRQMLTMAVIYALVITMLFLPSSVSQRVSAQAIDCTDPNKIFQECVLSSPTAQTLTNQAIDDVLAFYELGPAERANVLKYGRSEVRAIIYQKFIDLIKKESPTADEQQFISQFQNYIQQLRKKTALTARAEYQDWLQNACNGYQPPAPYTYSPGGGCSRQNVYFGGPKPPSFEEFQGFGAVVAYDKLNTPAANDASAETTQAIGFGVGAGLAAIGGAIGAAIGATISFGTLASIFPYASLIYAGGQFTGTTAAASAASGAVGAGAVGGAIAVVVATVAILVLQTINVVNQSELPGKLDQAVIDSDFVPGLRGLIATDNGNREFYGAFLNSTLPDFRDTNVAPPTANDRQFVARRDGQNGSSVSPTITYVRWEFGDNLNSPLRDTARLSGGWFVENRNGTEKQTLTIQVIDWSAKLVTATRKGGKFLVSEFNNPNNTKLVDELQYLGFDPTVGFIRLAAKIKYDQIEVLAAPVIVNCSTFTTIPDSGTGETVGTVAGSLDNPSALTVTVNGAASATVNNITVRNLSVRSDYKIQANVAYGAAATPSAANFTVTVRDSFGQEKSDTFSVKKTAIRDDFPATLPTNLNVGDNYSVNIGSNLAVEDCFDVTYSITSGSLPVGTRIVVDNAGKRIEGTLLSGGNYIFTLTKTYSNGEKLNRNYRIFVRGAIADLPNNFRSWWRAEDGPEDFTGRANGTLVGAVGFDNAVVNRGFKFNGQNGYVALPDDTFSPSSDFTFETWFQTATRGVILGRQRGVSPYDTPQFGATPAIYVDQNGRLRVQMFQEQNNQFITSSNRVDDNNFHHVAVLFSRSTNTRTVYLDGANVGSVNGGQDASPQKYQFGTGFINDGTVGGLTGWFNFNGLIDEPTLYDRVLSETEIRHIVAAGKAGKISVNIIAAPPTTRDGTDGIIQIEASGGSPALTYSINNGSSFNQTNSFSGLAPGTYTVIVRDRFNNRLTRTVTLTNPPPNLSLTTTTVSPSCFGVTDGEIRINATGLTGNAEYSILGGANQQSSPIFSNIGGGTYTPLVRDLNSNTSFTAQPFTLTQPAQYVLTPPNFANATTGTAYSRTFTLTGNTPPYTITAAGTNPGNGNALPAGLSATADGNSITISGTPTTGGTFPINISYRDRNSCFSSVTYNLTIISAGNVSISGRVTNGGQGLPNATITLSGGTNQTATTNSTGNYTLNNLPPNQDYTATVTSAGYTFAQPTIMFNALNANLSNADFATAFIHYEGDTMPRGIGDGAVNVTDFVRLNRVVNNLEARPVNGGEFQRASVAPRSNLGSTILSRSDTDQILRYILALDPLTLVGGPAQSSANASNSNFKSFDKPRVSNLFEFASVNAAATNSFAAAPVGVSAATVAASNGAATVPVSLNSDGTATAVQFTTTFDSSKLSLTSATSSTPTFNEVFFNTSIPGKVTVVALRRAGVSTGFPSDELIRLNFSVVQGATGSSPIDFNDTPTERIAADSSANPIAVSSSPGRVDLIAPTAANVLVSGRVLAQGRGVPNAVVQMTKVTGEIRTARTNPFGYYRFDEVEVGRTYIFEVSSKRFQFAPQVISLTEQFSGLNFIASP